MVNIWLLKIYNKLLIWVKNCRNNSRSITTFSLLLRLIRSNLSFIFFENVILESIYLPQIIIYFFLYSLSSFCRMKLFHILFMQSRLKILLRVLTVQWIHICFCCCRLIAIRRKTYHLWSFLLLYWSNYIILLLLRNSLSL